MTPTLDVQGLTVQIEGHGPTVVMLHGWPDTLALWDGAVRALSDGYRCVRFSLPGFDLAKPPRPVSVNEMCELVGAVVDAVSPDEPVTLLLHDWGCFFGYEVAARHPQRLRRLVITNTLLHAVPIVGMALVKAALGETGGQDGGVRGAQLGLEGPVGMGHQAQNRLGLVEDAGDVAA